MIVTNPEQMKRLEQAGCRWRSWCGRQQDLPAKGGLHSFAEMRTILQNLATSHPAIARLDSIGNTWEGRPILCLKVSDNVNATEESPAAVHGEPPRREWISVEVPLRFATMLVDSYGVNPAWTELVDEREYYIVPSVNPTASSTTTIPTTTGAKTAGTTGVVRSDLNRNYDGARTATQRNWGGEGSATPQSETYCGPSAFSELSARPSGTCSWPILRHVHVLPHLFELVMWPWATPPAGADVEILSALGRPWPPSSPARPGPAPTSRSR